MPKPLHVEDIFLEEPKLPPTESVDVFKPLVEISVAIHNQWSITEKFLKSLFETIKDYGKTAVNIIDNASTDSTVVHLESYSKKATIFSNDTNKGYAFAHNMIMRKSFANYSCVLHNDIIMPQGWLQRMVSIMEENPKIGVLGTVNDVHGQFIIGGVLNQNGSYEYVYQDEESGIEDKFDFIMSPCMLIRHKAHRSVGYFDEKFYLGYLCDLDYFMRMKDKGFEIGYASDVIVEHFQGSTARLIGVNNLFEVNREKLVEKHKDWFEKNKGKAIIKKRRAEQK